MATYEHQHIGEPSNSSTHGYLGKSLGKTGVSYS